MTQLFDTETYDDPEETGRHLRSIPVGNTSDFAERTTQWQLDENTIEIGRKGIQAARQALQDAARASKDTKPAKRAA